MKEKEYKQGFAHIEKQTKKVQKITELITSPKREESSNWDGIETLLKPYISFDDLFEIMKELDKNYSPPVKR